MIKGYMLDNLSKSTTTALSNPPGKKNSDTERPEIKVLLIEDNLAEARLFRELLQDAWAENFSLSHFQRLGTAKTEINRTHFDVVLLDLTLPDSNGLASLDALTQHAPSLPIVVLTNTNDAELALEAMRHGAQDYLLKRQVTLDILIRSIRYAIERKQNAEALREINETLELRVEERTAAVEAANEALSHEIAERESAQNRLELAQQAGKIGTFEWDITADKVTWSIELETLYGILPGSFGHSHEQWLAAIYPEDRQIVIEGLAKSRQLGQGLDLEFRIAYPDHHIHWIAVRSSVFLDQMGNPTRTIGIHMDITEKKQLEAQFLRAQRLESLGTLASGIAHDLNNVLTPILSVAQLLPLRLPNIDDRSKNLLAILESSAHRGADLIKQILSFAQGIEGKHLCIQPTHLLVEIQKIVQQTLPKSIVILTGSANEIDRNIPADLWTVLGDLTQLHQVLMNLCVNARDAMPQGGTLSIVATNRSIDAAFASKYLDAQVGDYVVISISDTGTGIQPQLLHRIFDPFFTTKEVGKGTGLGLSAVLGIIKTHGGFLDVQSQVNQGTQIDIYLPASHTLTQSDIVVPALPAGKQQLILAIDDERAIGELIKSTLETYNYRVITAESGAEALELYVNRVEEIDLVLIDMMMPIMDGLSTITALHQLNPDLPIVAMSGLSSTEAIAQAKRFGCRYFLPKPYTTSDLLQVIADFTKAG
jgi:two-component system, cell cycle sensor histidine kinase and response regulator CckA